MHRDLTAVLEAWTARFGGGEYRAQGRADAYRQIRPVGWPGSTHYELILGQGEIGAELHIERSELFDRQQEFIDALQPLVQGLQGIVIGPRWQGGQNQGNGVVLGIRKPSGEAREVGMAMVSLILATHSTMNELLGLPPPANLNTLDVHWADPDPDDAEAAVLPPKPRSTGMAHRLFPTNEFKLLRDTLLDDDHPFVLLAGISGTGKTQVARLLADQRAGVQETAGTPWGDGSFTQLLVPEDKAHPAVELVPVRPEWTEARDLTGYLDPLTGTFRATQVTGLILNAWLEMMAKGPEAQKHTLILDEMNLARPEYYLSDLLSLRELPWSHGAGVEPKGKERVRIHAETACVATAQEETRGAPNGTARCVAAGDGCKTCPLGPLRGEAAWTSEQRAGQLPKAPAGARWVPPYLAYPQNLGIVGTVNVDETTFGFSPKVLDRALVLELNDVSYLWLAENVVAGPDRQERLALLEACRNALEAISLHPGYRGASRLLAAPREQLDLTFIGTVLPKLRGHGKGLETALDALADALRDSPLDLARSHARVMKLKHRLGDHGVTGFF